MDAGPPGPQESPEPHGAARTNGGLAVENADFHARLSTDALQLRAILADGDLAREVPGCPGWDLAELGQHVGGIYRFATVGIVEGRGEDEPTGPRERAELLDWFDAGLAGLLAAFEPRDWDRECWTLSPPHRVGFWVRRMCHETSLHLWDAETAQGRSPRIDPALAADGADEVVTMFFPRQVRLGRIAPLRDSVQVVLTDRPGAPAMMLSGNGSVQAEAVVSDAVVRGPASDVLLMLWKRLPRFPSTVEVDGDWEAFERVFATALTP
jgi:uncharacterized protein (TIGR03083 family)